MLRSALLLAVLVPTLAIAQTGRGRPDWAGAFRPMQVQAEADAALPESGAPSSENIEKPDYTAESFRLAQAPEAPVGTPFLADDSELKQPAFRPYDPNTEFDTYWSPDQSDGRQ